MNGEWYHTYNQTVVSRQSVDDDGVIALTVGIVSLTTGVGLRPQNSTTTANDDGSGDYIHACHLCQKFLQVCERTVKNKLKLNSTENSSRVVQRTFRLFISSYYSIGLTSFERRLWKNCSLQKQTSQSSCLTNILSCCKVAFKKTWLP